MLVYGLAGDGGTKRSPPGANPDSGRSAGESKGPVGE